MSVLNESCETAGVPGGVLASEDELEGKQMPLSREIWDMECLEDNWRVRCVSFAREDGKVDEVEEAEEFDVEWMASSTWQGWALSNAMSG